LGGGWDVAISVRIHKNLLFSQKFTQLIFVQHAITSSPNPFNGRGIIIYSETETDLGTDMDEEVQGGSNMTGTNCD
jgi:hypothetical protein